MQNHDLDGLPVEGKIIEERLREAEENAKKSETQSFTQIYKLAKATKNGAKITAIDSKVNSTGYINLRMHDAPYFYVSKRLLESLEDGGRLPVMFKLTLEPVEWE